MRRYSIVLTLSTLIALAATAAAPRTPPKPESGVKVEKIVVATGVTNLEPVGEGSEFPASAGTVYCWTKVSTASVPATIKHLWYLGDKKVFEFPLDLKFNSTRTWSRKSIKPGDWRVDVTDEAGNVLSSISFTVK